MEDNYIEVANKLMEDEYIMIAPKLLRQYLSKMNEICSANGVQVQFTENDWVDYLSKKNTLWTYKDHLVHPIKKFLQDKMKNRKSSSVVLYRFMLSDRLLEILQKEKIRIYSMEKMTDIDDCEYSEYFRIVNSNFSNTEIQNSRETTYILCFTNNYKNDRQWKEYTNYSGVCAEIEIFDKNYRDPWIWKFRDVCYDNENSFKFIRDIIAHFRDKYSINIVLPTHKFAQFYKRGGPEGYSWEEETRICIQEDNTRMFTPYYDDLFKLIPKEEDKSLCKTINYLNAPIDNCLFSMKIRKIYLGSKFSLLCNKPLLEILKSKKIPYEKVN